MLIQLGEESQATTMLMEIVQKLKETVVRLRENNEQLMRDQERIIKSLTDKRNQGILLQ